MPLHDAVTNALTVDVEEYFHVEAFASLIAPATWETYASRVETSVARLLELFERFQVHATFFILGWVAQRHPAMVKRIASLGHEIACHGSNHQHLSRLTPQEFREDVQSARSVLQDLTGSAVECYRAPSFSIVASTMWALDVLAETGFVRDSSVFPIVHDLYGIPEASRFPAWMRTPSGKALFEFPPSTFRKWGLQWGVGGGGYLRIFPYWWTRWCFRHIHGAYGQPAMVYVHPWELDPGQPRIAAGRRSRFRQYHNLRTTERKLARLLSDFRFTTFSECCAALEAYKARPPHSG